MVKLLNHCCNSWISLIICENIWGLEDIRGIDAWGAS